MTNNSSISSLFEVVPHIFATIWVVLIVTGISIFIYFYYKKINPKKKPKGFQVVIETGFENFHSTMENTAGPRLKKAYPYFFTLFIFIFVSTIMELFGFVSPAGSIAFTFALGMVTFIGIFVIGIFTTGFFRFLKNKYINPLQIIGQFSPLISISLRLFGATFAASLLGQILLIILNSFITAAPLVEAIPFINIFYQVIMFSITIIFGGLQSFVFVMLTMIYWSQELGDKKERKEIKKEKKLNKKNKNVSIDIIENTNSSKEV